MSKKSQRPRVSLSQAREDLRQSGTQEGSPGMLIAALVGTTLFMGFYYHGLVLNQMTQLSDGITMLDHRFTYSVADVEALAATLNNAAMGQLNWIHKTAGVIFPIFVALSVWVTTLWAQSSRALRWASGIVGVVFVVVDIWENIAIETALIDPTSATVALASALTSARWVLLAVMVVWLVLMLVAKFRNRLK